ncbi:PKS-like enzyme [Penicillium angulare]|uniref:PKS-like enzyme n=1 Tax=Penicillium angulare TaxID=116970 RepID=A0A9W9FHE9_9EURO|nr:PKS-like enzyme [Penicillium angulare]
MDSMNSISSPQTFMAQPLAVVGMACRLPGDSNSPTALWRFLEKGGIASHQPPLSRFNIEGHEDGTKRAKTMRSPGGMFLENIDPADIDAQFFGLSRAEATAMDPQQRQLLEVVYEGLENAGIPLDSLHGQPVGCFVGSYASDWGDIQARDPEDRVPNATVGIGRAMLSNRISHFLNIKGPSMTIDTACSGSLVSLDVASRYLQTGEIDTAIVAGCNLYMSPEHNIDMSNLSGAASPSGRCHTFDAKADGYIKSEAVNMVILKRLPDAIQAKDPIRAIIRGSATNSDGWTAGIASPSPEAQAAATRQAYINAGITDLNSTSYVECHGTGTRAGDPIEVNSVASVFCATRSSDRPLLIGSIKSNIGHSEPAAGISGMIKTILALESGLIPGNPTFETPNPAIHFNELKVRAFQPLISWPSVPFRRASINSYGYGGSNVHVILDEARTGVPPSATSFKSSYLTDEDDFFADEVHEGPQILVFSANEQSSLTSYIKSLQKHLINPGVRVSLSDLAYTLSERRSRHFHRAYSVSQTCTAHPNSLVYGKPRPNPPRVGFIFTGQGSQWPQMGKLLIDTFPSSRALLKRLDNVLKALPDPPNWSLYDELTCQRSSEYIRQPEFSQPLVTALQLLLLEILDSWGVLPASVVGHSSGEIAASVAAGYLTSEQAIQVAYYRGKAAVDLQNVSRPNLGMLAVGLGENDHLISQIIQSNRGLVFIACVNSPASVTLSGDVSVLEKVAEFLQGQDHFARLLRVDLAYHSPFMEDVAKRYKSLLDAQLSVPCLSSGPTKMFSSVTGEEMKEAIDNAYWKTNMESPVLFDKAVQAMLSDNSPADFIIEVGPSGALAGPVKQILNTLPGKASHVEYHAACKRETSDAPAILHVAGKLFLAGAPVKINQVNAQSRSKSPSVIVDLPNYSWNHTIKYWWESKSSKDWRLRRYPNHDLLGGKVLGTPWVAPMWKNVLRLSELTWLQDHKIGGQVLFPAAGYIAMAIEALFQMAQSRELVASTSKVYDVSYKLRNVKFIKAMALDAGSDQRVMLTLNPVDESADAWNEFAILTLDEDDTTKTHCSGIIALTKPNEDPSFEAAKPLRHPISSHSWYQALRSAGYSFGSSFKSLIELEAVAGMRCNRALVSFEQPPSAHAQSPYSVHPVAIDGCLQSGAPSLWRGIRSAVGFALVPAVIDETTVNAHDQILKRGVSNTSAEFSGVGSREGAQNYNSNIQVHDAANGKPLIEVCGLWYNKLDVDPETTSAHTLMRLDWKPDISKLKEAQMQEYLNTRSRSLGNRTSQGGKAFFELLLHKSPSLTVAEFSTLALSGSPGLKLLGSEPFDIQRNVKYHFMAKNMKILHESREMATEYTDLHMGVLDVTKPTVDLSVLPDQMDVVILRLGKLPLSDLKIALSNVKSLLREMGYLIVLWNPDQNSDDSDDSASKISLDDSSDLDLGSDYIVVQNYSSKVDYLLRQNAFEKVVHIDSRSMSFRSLETAIMGQMPRSTAFQVPSNRADVALLHLSDIEKPICKSLTACGIGITEHFLPQPIIPAGSTVLIIDELYSPVLSRVSQNQWEVIQSLIATECKVLWVTSGAQLEVTNPHSALVYGLSRVMRAEDPSVSFTLLDIESATSAFSVNAMRELIVSLHAGSNTSDDTGDYEFVERKGVINISRVYPDTPLNKSEHEAASGAPAQTRDLFDHPSCVRLVCRQPGKLQSICFEEVSTSPVPLEDDFVEVEMYAAGVNYKDVATCLGIVPENEEKLGLEGAGIICRIGSKVSSFYVGQRVVVNRRGSFGNKVQCPIQGVHAIPDSMTFEEAATLPVVYLSVINALFEMANIQKGQSVLIHSAAGGVGLAAIQICQYVGADIFVTVGNDEKKDLLSKKFKIPVEHIFSSRNAGFASRILRITHGRGIDVVLNTLTGNLLEESWRIVAPHMSHKSITRQDTQRLMTKLFELINGGHIRPLEPRTEFAYNDIVGAIRYMRGGAHVGKIVVSRNLPGSNTKVPIFPARQKLRLDGDKSYLIVGGLKGLCGSLAVYLACHGAKHLIIMSRSGYDDDKSQGILKDISSLGAQCELVKGDVSVKDDVRRALQQSPRPIGGIVQGAMVLKDGIYTSMTSEQFRDVLDCKVSGSWNLHEVITELGLQPDFFTMLSSISGLIGQKGQANYAAANTFLDSFATYRHQMGLPACSVDLGVIEGVGYVSENQSIANRFDTKTWTPINESLLHRILRVSIMEQNESAHIITGVSYPQSADGLLLRDPRFTTLMQHSSDDSLDYNKGDRSEDSQALLSLIRATEDPVEQLAATIEVVNQHFMRSLGLAEPMESAKPLSAYGLDSLAAVDFRNWMRQEFKMTISTLEVVSAKTLSALCERIVIRLKENV